MADVFISYARSERDSAERIAARLQQSDITVFFDVDRLEVGEVFTDRIDFEVKRAGAVLGLWSPVSLSRPWVKLECDIGKRRGVLVPAAIRPFTEMDVPAAFWNVQYIDLTQLTDAPTDPNWILLLKSLSRSLQRPDLAQIEKTVGAKAAYPEEILDLITSAVNDRLKESETRAAQAIADVHLQFQAIADSLKNEHASQLRQIEERLQVAPSAFQEMDGELDRLADRVDERVRESERRTAEAIGQIGEQVARAVERLQAQQADVASSINRRLEDSVLTHQARVEAFLNRRLDEATTAYQLRIDAMLQELQPIFEQIKRSNANSLMPLQMTISDFAQRLAALERSPLAGPKAS